jgi:hypothetical protein
MVKKFTGIIIESVSADTVQDEKNVRKGWIKMINKHRLLVTLVITVILFLVSSNQVVSGSDQGDNGYLFFEGSRAENITKNDEWVVTGPEDYEDQMITVKGNIVIKSGGVLTLTDVRLAMDTKENPLIINVTEGGTLLVYDSTISISTAMPDEHNSYEFKIFGNSVIDNSEVYYVGHRSDNCSDDNDTGSGCGSSTDLPTYDLPWNGWGIEVYSDNVSISNSKIKYGSCGVSCFSSSPEITSSEISDNLYGILIFSGSPTIEGNDIRNNSIGIFSNNSKFDLENCNVVNNQYGVSVWSSEISVNGSVFAENYEGAYGWNSTLLSKNSEFNNNQHYGISFYESNITVEKCSISLCFFGLYLDNSEVAIDNTEIHDNWVGIQVDYCTGSIMNSYLSLNSYQGLSTYDSTLEIYKCTIMGGESSYPDLYPNNIGIYGAVSNLTIHDCSILNTRTGIDDGYASNFDIYNNEITNNYYGLYNYYAYNFEVHDNKIEENIYGIFSWESNLNIRENQILRNRVGFTYIQSVKEQPDWEIHVEDNIIADNTGWGIYSLNHELEIDQNIFIDDDSNPNGLGIYIQEYSLIVNVYDTYDEPISQAKVEVKDKSGASVVSGMTVTDGIIEIENLTSYEITNDNTKISYTPHDIIVKWGTDDYGYVSKQKSIELNSISNETFKFKLPDLSIKNEDIKVSKSRPRSGDKVTIEATVHYTGDMPASDVVVRFTANGLVIGEVQIDDISSGESKKVMTEWEVYSISDDDITIRVRVEPPWGFEYHKDVYLNNNDATIQVAVKGEDEPYTGFSLTGDECIMLVPILILLLIVVLITIFIYVIKRRMAKKKSEEEKEKEMEEERAAGPGKGRRLSPRGPPGRRPPIPPQSGGKPPQRPGDRDRPGRGGIRRVENPWK